MRLIDTHCHIENERFDGEVEAVIDRAKAAGVERIYLPNVDIPTLPKVLEMADRYPDYIIPMMGIHPTEITANYKDDLKLVREYLGKRHFAAVGEIGVDLYWDKTFKKEQMLAFEDQINMSLEFNLPINIHVRDAFNEAFEVLETFKGKGVRGAFHCFSGSKEVAERVFRLGDFYLGIGGVVTFKNAKLPEVIKAIGLDRLVLETDAPFLAPAPHRGKRNESAYLVDMAKFIAEQLNTTPEHVAEVTTANALKMFS